MRSNAARDARDQERLSDLGWRIHIIWECEITDERLDALVHSLKGTEITRR